MCAVSPGCRYLVATRSFNPGDTVLQSRAFASAINVADANGIGARVFVTNEALSGALTAHSAPRRTVPRVHAQDRGSGATAVCGMLDLLLLQQGLPSSTLEADPQARVPGVAVHPVAIAPGACARRGAPPAARHPNGRHQGALGIQNSLQHSSLDGKDKWPPSAFCPGAWLRGRAAHASPRGPCAR
jgi:hypothetical protein